MSHTKEPIMFYRVWDMEAFDVGNGGYDTHIGPSETLPPTSWIPLYGQDEIDALKRQRDELLAALKRIATGGGVPPPVRVIARYAIAKVEAQS